MDKSDRRFWKSQATDALEKASYAPGKLALIHTAASAGLALLIAALSFYLDLQIADTGGLSGIGTRSILETIQVFLQMANVLLLPFWEMGILWAFLCVGRHWEMGPKSLLAGFHRFGPILRGKLLQAMMLTGTAFIGCYVGTFLFSVTPLSNAFYEAAQPYMAQGVLDYAVMMEDEAVMAAILWALPFMVVCMAIFTIPLYYRLRMMDYVLLDQPEKGAFFAMRASKIMMRGKRWSLFKLDLSFWWFYALEMIISLVCYGDVLLPALGVDLGMSADAAFFAFYALALLCQVGLYAWQKPKLLTTYGLFYGAVLPKEEPAAQ